MITKAILEIVYAVINALLLLMPTFSTNFANQVINGWNGFIQTIEPILFFFPIDTLVLCITVIMAIHGAQLTWYIINWSIRKVPTIS